MRCYSPFYNKEYGILCPCGQCIPCLINRRRGWVVRMFLEALNWKHNSFLTLTYDNKKFNPDLESDGNLVPSHLTNFWKRLRKVLPHKIRYFACGEYGTQFKRPHYHAIVFNLDTNSLSMRRLITQTWGLGHVDFGSVSKDSMQYVAGYTCKRYAGYREDVKNGKVREFCRMSLKPGIGATSLELLRSKAFLQNDGLDVLSTLKIGDKDFPIPRYLRSKLREMCFDEEYINLLKEVTIDNMKSEVNQLIRMDGFNPLAINPINKDAYAIEAYDRIVGTEVRASVLRNQRKNKRSLF